MLLKKSGYNINLFKLTSINLTKRQWIIIFSNFFIEVVWEIGYYATSVFLMHTTDGIFNTYSYLESVLDIFNSFYFAFIMITSVDIADKLGQDDFDNAKQISKYSIFGSLMIWLFHSLLAIVLIYPISLG